MVILAALALLAGVWIYNTRMLNQHPQRPPHKDMVQRADVSVIPVTAAPWQARVDGYGAVSAHFELTLTARVAGQVDSLDPSFDTGLRVPQGRVLVQLEDSDYQAAVASAANDLASAKVDLLEEEREGVQALAEWKSSGMKGQPDSPLVLRQPQLASARAAYHNAETALASAQKDLRNTRITAPFDAVVIAREVAPGSYVATGGEIGTLYSTDRVEIPVQLSARDWAALPGTDILSHGDWPAEVQDVENGQTWPAHVLRVGQHLDDTTRQRSIILAVDRPLDRSPALFPGTFVQAFISGRKVDGLWKLPSSALSQRGEIWYVREDDSLASFAADPVFTDAGFIYVHAPEALASAPQKVLTHPLNGYLQGMRVHPVEVAAHE